MTFKNSPNPQRVKMMLCEQGKSAIALHHNIILSNRQSLKQQKCVYILSS